MQFQKVPIVKALAKKLKISNNNLLKNINLIWENKLRLMRRFFEDEIRKKFHFGQHWLIWLSKGKKLSINSGNQPYKWYTSLYNTALMKLNMKWAWMIKCTYFRRGSWSCSGCFRFSRSCCTWSGRGQRTLTS